MDTSARVFVAGGDTLIGSAVVAALARHGHTAVLVAEQLRSLVGQWSTPGCAGAWGADGRG